MKAATERIVPKEDILSHTMRVEGPVDVRPLPVEVASPMALPPSLPASPLSTGVLYEPTTLGSLAPAVSLTGSSTPITVTTRPLSPSRLTSLTSPPGGSGYSTPPVPRPHRGIPCGSHAGSCGAHAGSCGAHAGLGHLHAGYGQKVEVSTVPMGTYRIQ